MAYNLPNAQKPERKQTMATIADRLKPEIRKQLLALRQQLSK